MNRFFILVSGILIETTKDELNRIVLQLESSNKDYLVSKQEMNESEGIMHSNIILNIL